MALAPSTIGRYVIQQRLGQGGMGVLFLARDPHIGRLVALKLLHDHLAQSDIRARFAQEARAAGALTHPNIVTIHDFGEWDSAPFIVMEYVSGETLAEIIARRPATLIDIRLRWTEEMCAGLSFAHAAGVVHRDIKPANLMIDQHGTLKILDFGIACVSDSSSLTSGSSVIGTPSYMSPEQILGETVDHRSDMFSAGAVLYELLSGQKAFEGRSPHTVMHRVVNEDPPPLASRCPDVDPRIEQVVRTALQKDPAGRFATMSAMRASIARVRADLTRSKDALTVLAPLATQPPAPPPGDEHVVVSADVDGPPTSRAARPPRLASARTEGDAGAAMSPRVVPSTDVDATRMLDDVDRRRARAAEACEQARAALKRGARFVARHRIDEALALDPQNEAALRLLGQVGDDPAGGVSLRGSHRVEPESPATDAFSPMASAERRGRAVRAGGLAAALVAAVVLAVIGMTGVWPREPASSAPGPAGTAIDAAPAAVAPREIPVAPVVTDSAGATEDAPVDAPPPPAPVRATPAQAKAAAIPPRPRDASPKDSHSAESTGAAERRRADRISTEIDRAQRAETAGEYNQALQRYNQVLQLDPGNLAATRGRARVAAERRNSADRLVRRALQFYEVADYEAAIRDLTSALTIDASHAAARQQLERVRMAQAADSVRRRGSSDPD